MLGVNINLAVILGNIEVVSFSSFFCVKVPRAKYGFLTLNRQASKNDVVKGVYNTQAYAQQKS
jgi:hypothetical protein